MIRPMRFLGGPYNGRVVDIDVSHLVANGRIMRVDLRIPGYEMAMYELVENYLMWAGTELKDRPRRLSHRMVVPIGNIGHVAHILERTLDVMKKLEEKSHSEGYDLQLSTLKRDAALLGKEMHIFLEVYATKTWASAIEAEFYDNSGMRML